MDLRASLPYVARAMEFLLILSAMLSAITGVFSGARAPEARPLHVVAAAKAPCPDRLARMARADARIPEQGRQVAAIFAAPAQDVPRSVPLYANRLIE